MHSDEQNRIQVADHFAASSRDLSPQAVDSQAQVLYTPFTDDVQLSRHCAFLLTQQELSRAGRFAKEEDRHRYVQRRAFRRFCMARALGHARVPAEIRFGETDKGGPFLVDFPDVHFSFSSARGGCVGAWSKDHGIGVDVEELSRVLDAAELARANFTGAESDIVCALVGRERKRAFLHFWTLKEAALKSIGEGLPFGLDRFEFALEPGPYLLQAPASEGGAGAFKAFLAEDADQCVAIVLHDRP
jgi:4'-phosphopantetheinyl transferase